MVVLTLSIVGQCKGNLLYNHMTWCRKTNTQIVSISGPNMFRGKLVALSNNKLNEKKKEKQQQLQQQQQQQQQQTMK